VGRVSGIGGSGGGFGKGSGLGSGSGGFGKGMDRVEVRVKWDPSPLGEPDTDLDIIAGPYEGPYRGPYTDGRSGGAPAYLVHYDSRSPDGTIWLNHDSRTGKGLGWDEVMTLQLGRLSERYGRVVVGVAIQQRPVRRLFARVAGPAYQVVAGYDVLAEGDFAAVADATAASIAEFVRAESGAWEFRPVLRGFDADPDTFARTMGDGLE
jgi:tellurium resistance protein TerD